ncbi:MAG TPA: ABC transporter ATP-binding protein [Planctomycetota bacterium]
MSAEHLVKNYGQGDSVVRALRDVSFSIARGEFVAVMGASGSGKSTLMNILGCLDRPTEGRYVLEGRNISSESRKSLARLRLATLGFVFQSFQLLPRLTTQENVELPLHYAKGVSGRERRERASAVLEQVELGAKAKRRPTELSGGQQQRVAIARALVNRPKILLADEPTGNLDTRTGLEILSLLQKLNREGLTIVLVTHEMDVAACAGRRLLLRDGHLTGDLRHTPVDARQQLLALPKEDEAPVLVPPASSGSPLPCEVAPASVPAGSGLSTPDPQVLK